MGMNKRSWLLGVMFLILLSSVSATSLNDSLVSYWKFDGNATDMLGLNNGSVSGATIGGGKLEEGYFFDGSNDYISFGYDTYEYTDMTVSFWLNYSSATGTLFSVGARAWTAIGYDFGSGANTYQIQYAIYDGGAYQVVDSGANDYNDGSFHHIVSVHNSSEIQLYIDGSLVDSQSITGVAYASGRRTTIGGVDGGGSVGSPWLGGSVDEVAVWDRTLNSSEISQLYNSSNAYSYENIISSGGSPPTPTPTLTATDTPIPTAYENESLTYNLSIAWTNQNGTDTTASFIYNGINYTPTLDDSAYGLNGSDNYSVTVPAAFVDVNASDMTYQWYYTFTMNTTTSNYSTTQRNQTIYYNFPRVNITAVNAYSGQNLTDFTGNITTIDGYYHNISTSTGYDYIRLPNTPNNYTIYVEAPGYAITNDTNYQTLEITDPTNLTTREVEFQLYSSNSVYIYIRQETDSVLITDYVAITVTGNATEQIYNTTNGSYFLQNLTDGEYTFTFNSDNYTQRSYEVTVADNSYQVLNAYLSSETSTVIMTVQDFETGTTIEGASIIMSKLINDSFVIIESLSSDITGRAQFTYTTGLLYRFQVTASGYEPKTFDLNPVLFSSYSIRMNKIITANDTSDYSQVSININPSQYYEDELNNFTIFFISPAGVFESYNYTLVYPGGIYSGSGVSATGQSFNHVFNITGTSRYDTVNLTYIYDATTAEPKTFYFEYEIIPSSGLFGTAEYNRNNPYNIPLLDRMLIAIFALVIVAGVAYFFGGLVTSGLSAIVVMGYFAYIEFIPFWSVIVSIVVLFASISWGSTR